MERNSVVVAGSLNYDYILQVDRLPDEGETMTAGAANPCCGGKGANQAAQCARLGLTTYMSGAVGSDFMGDALLMSLAQTGADTGLVRRVEGETSGFAAVHAMPGGSVHATIVRGANYAVTKADIDLLEPLLKKSALLLLQLEIPTGVVEYAIAKAKACGCGVMLNAAPALPLSQETLRQSDILLLNEVEAEFYCGQPVRDVASAKTLVCRLAGELGNTCVFTLGKSGAVAAKADGSSFFCPACDVKAVETTGAGDSFAGGLAYATIKGMELSRALRFSSCCSGVTVQRVGAQAAMPSLAEAELLMHEFF